MLPSNKAEQWNKYKTMVNSKRYQLSTCERCLKQFMKTNKARHMQTCKELLKMTDTKDNDNFVLVQDTDYDIGLQHFKVDPLKKIENDRIINFRAPFTVKVMAPRSGGKTTFTVNYILKNAQYIFRQIYFVTSTIDQLALNPLRDVSNVTIANSDILPEILNKRKILIILDDLMQELRNVKAIENIYSKGRHQEISIISLEQDTTYSDITERRNVDYYVLFQTRDRQCIKHFYRCFCSDMRYDEFSTYYNFCVFRKGFAIIDFVSDLYKYRVNSFNNYYCKDDYEIYEIISNNNTSELLELNNHFKNYRRTHLKMLRQNYQFSTQQIETNPTRKPRKKNSKHVIGYNPDDRSKTKRELSLKKVDSAKN